MRRASLVGLGDDRLAGDVPRRRSTADAPHPTRHRCRQPPVPPPVQRRPAHGPARPHVERAGDVRVGPRRPPVRCPHARHRSDGAARPSGRGALGDHPRLLRGEERFSYHSEVVRAQRGQAPTPARAGGHADGDGVVDLAVGDDARRQVRHGRAVDRLEFHRGHPGAAHTVELRRGRRRQARPDGRSQELAR